jgi:hypothetical protein
MNSFDFIFFLPSAACGHCTKLNLIVVFGTCVVLSFFAIDAVYTENKFQLFAFFALSAILFARIVWGYSRPARCTGADTYAYVFITTTSNNLFIYTKSRALIRSILGRLDLRVGV